MDLTIPYHLANFIGGRFVNPLSGHFIDNINPATGEVFCQIPDSNEDDIGAAVSAAQQAFPQWLVTPVEQRFKILNNIATLIDERLDELARAEADDRREQVAPAIEAILLRSSEHGIKASAIKALTTWGTPKSSEAVIDFLTRTNQPYDDGVREAIQSADVLKNGFR